jgi:hypothetical protein
LRKFERGRRYHAFTYFLATASLVLGGCASRTSEGPAAPPVVHYVYNCNSGERSYDGDEHWRGGGEFSIVFAQDGTIRERRIQYQPQIYADGMLSMGLPKPSGEPPLAWLNWDDFGFGGDRPLDWDSGSISFRVTYDWDPAKIPNGFSQGQILYVPGRPAHIRHVGDEPYFDYSDAPNPTANETMPRSIGELFAGVKISQARVWAETTDALGIYNTALTKAGFKQGVKGKQPDRYVVAYFQLHLKVLLTLVDQIRGAEEKWEKEEIGDFRQSKFCTKAEDPQDHPDIIVMRDGALREVTHTNSRFNAPTKYLT